MHVVLGARTRRIIAAYSAVAKTTVHKPPSYTHTAAGRLLTYQTAIARFDAISAVAARADPISLHKLTTLELQLLR